MDLAGSSSVEPESIDPILGIAYGIVGPVIVTFGLIGNLLILVVVGKSSMKGSFFSNPIVTPNKRQYDGRIWNEESVKTDEKLPTQ